MDGVSTEVANAAGTTFNASAGRPVLFSGVRVPFVVDMPGRVYAVGAQTAITPNLQAGIQFAGAEGVSAGWSLANQRGKGAYSSNGAIASAAWSGNGVQVQANAIAVDSSFAGLNGGTWVDGIYHGDSVDHAAGLFWMQPGLTWGNQQVVTDLRGAYYRASSAGGGQWLWDGGVDYAEPVSGAYRGSTFFTGSARYQYSRNLGVGGGGNARIGPAQGYSGFVFLEQHNRYGTSRLQINGATEATRNGMQIMLDQNWATPSSFRLSTGLALRQTNEAGQGGATQAGVTVYGGGDIGSNVTIDGNVQLLAGDGSVGQSNYINLGAVWRFMPRASLSLYAYQTTSRSWRPLVVDSPIANPELLESQKIDSRAFYLTLRYDFSAGSRVAPLGGSGGDAGGRILGTVFFDQNDDGRLGAGERGIPNAIVTLNGRFTTRTDASGRFEFPSVSPGQHVIVVQRDNIPLPWALHNDGRKEVVVGIRDTTQVEIGAATSSARSIR